MTIDRPAEKMRVRPATRSRNIMKPRRIRESPGDRALLVVIYLGLTLAVLVVLLPLLYIVASSFSSPHAVTAGQVFLWPVDFTLKGYQTVLADPQVLLGYANSLFYMIAGTLISTTLTVCLAWPLSRRTFMGRNVIMSLLLFTMLFSGGLIPTYMVVQNLGLLDTRWALLLPQAVAVWQVIIARTFFRSAIPEELVEAASLDGASDWRFLWTVVLPLSKPLIAVIALMYAIGQWNGYFDALLYLKSSDLFPLQLVLRNILVLNSTNGGVNDLAAQAQNQELVNVLKYALIVITSVPVLIIYPFVARYFNKGVLIGSVKG
ncbi:carbohydrate ABC transporter permease [uncultured Leifsonia sp.]|uniref:carbohydrate ABC transporter permease n=1 Tax=uncultured Leifsonia sp. TaxID=340359 RepID=UPI0025DB7DB9|nr:carbohydrate ABC transporter permease [uncultured Leifsonia sp.]